MSLINGKMRPNSVLDVGMGWGKWGFLIRGQLDCCRNGAQKQKWTKRIDAIEIFEPFITPLHHYLYTNIYTIDFRDFQAPTNYDLMIMGDSLEHVTKEEGKEFLQRAMQWSRNIIISVPGFKDSQGERLGNIHETHRAWYQPEDFSSILPNCVVKVTGKLITASWRKR
jgi:hypothetical protein